MRVRSRTHDNAKRRSEYIRKRDRVKKNHQPAVGARRSLRNEGKEVKDYDVDRLFREQAKAERELEIRKAREERELMRASKFMDEVYKKNFVKTICLFMSLSLSVIRIALFSFFWL